jgi:group II intron reverse transcriptase/maturase
MNGHGKSDSPVVPAKPPNNTGQPVAEVVEERGLAKGNTDGSTRPGHGAGQGVPSGLDRVREAAKRDRKARFTALLHHVDLDALRRAYRAIKPKAAAGVDGVTWKEYGVLLEANLHDLHRRVHSGGYRAKPVRRAYIPKADGRLRPLGIAALEDKIVQRAVVEVLQAIYETDFLGFSYGFRPGRGQHDALDALAAAITGKRVNWVLDADIRDFFGQLDRSWLTRFVEHRIADPRVLRLIDKWLNAGVLEDGEWSDEGQGTPQGASVSPLLGNVYLHYVLDLWAHDWRKRYARGDVVIVRYADDVVVGFEREDDARRFWAELGERLAKFGLELAADKTRLVEFGRFAAHNRARRGLGRPETFAFLGLVHICATTRSGRFMLQRITLAKRMAAKLRAINQELKRRWHHSIPEQGRWLRSVVDGHLEYYAVPTNSRAIGAFRHEVVRLWYKALRRRSQRTRITWQRMGPIADRWLPPARIRHPWPEQRFRATTRGRSPVR